MKATIKNFEIDLSKPIDISLPITNDEHNPIAWYQNAPEIQPVVMGDWIGKVSEGQSSTNFNNLFFNPHAHGTHTECLGHITKEFYSINQCLKQFFFWATLITVQPEKVGEDEVISKEQIEKIKGILGPTNYSKLKNMTKEFANGCMEPREYVDFAACGLRIRPRRP